MPINVAEAIDSDTAEIVTVERVSRGAYNNGIWVEGAPSRFVTVCSVQQPTPDELQFLPEGERDKDIRKFISKRVIRPSRDRDGSGSDVVLYKGIRYKIISANDWDVYGYTESFGAREL